MKINALNPGQRRAVGFIVLIGCTSLLADMTYEGARSINGPFLKVLGASGTVVGIVAGFGELVGYALRLWSGRISDKSHKYWVILFTGYIINLMSVPLLAFAGYWQLAIILMIAERAGKAIRSPTKDSLLSFAASQTGRGWGFGLHEFMDQLGATLGPLLVSAILYFKSNNFSLAYLVLLVPALGALSVLALAKKIYPRPQDLQIKTVHLEEAPKIFTPAFILFALAAMCVATGYADFSLIAYHLKQHILAKDYWIPALYSLAMLSEAISALVLGRLYDKMGSWALVLALSMSMFFAPLVFLMSFNWAILGMLLWGIGMGAQGSTFKAIISGIVPSQKMASAFGIFDTLYGVAWFAGSACLGYLYDHSLHILVGFSVVIQFIAVLILTLFLVRNKIKNN
jgi:MFS family permease